MEFVFVAQWMKHLPLTKDWLVSIRKNVLEVLVCELLGPSKRNFQSLCDIFLKG